MKIEKRLIKDLKPAEYNPRKSTEFQEQKLAESLKKFGCVEPIIINENPERHNVIIGGYFRVRELEKLGKKEVDCVVVNLSLKDEKELNIRLNANTGEWDLDLLADSFDFKDLQDWGLNLEFDIEDNRTEPREYNEDKIPDIKRESKTKLGDVWILGKHKLLCGDSTDKKSYDILLESNKVDLTFTSPPYNATRDKYLDKETNNIDNFDIFLNNFTKLCLDKSLDVLANIQFLQSNKAELFKYLLTNNKLLKNIFVWNKKQGQPTAIKNTVIPFIEFIFHFNNKDNTTIGTKEFQAIPNIVEISRSCEGNNKYADIHNAVFPEALPLYFIENLVKENGSVLEPFCGTGSTLIACERLNKTCYAIELNPLYCDVIIERWQNFTGQKVIRVDGKKYDEI